MVNVKKIDELKTQLGNDLVSVISYNSGLLIILGKIRIHELDIIKSVSLPSCPLLFTKEGIKDSADVFPIEILEIKNSYNVLYGLDVLKSISLDNKNIRLQLELELRSKLIHLREHYLQVKKSQLKNLFKTALDSIEHLMNALFYLKVGAYPNSRDEMLQKIKMLFSIDALEIFKNPSEIQSLMEVLEQLISVVDTMKV